MKENLIEIMSTVLEVQIDENSTKDSVETWDSFKHIELIYTIEEEFGIKIEPNIIPTLTSFKNIYAKIQEK